MVANLPECVLESEVIDDYVSRGWHAFPVHGIVGGVCTCNNLNCNSAGKHPACDDGVKEATADSQELEAWFTKFPKHNIAIRTGKISGLVVLDVDPDHGGTESLQSLIHKHGPLPSTVCVQTGSDGQHYYFRYPQNREVRNRTAIKPGVDVRGDDGYVVAPPSRHRSGGTYQWSEAGDPANVQIAELPAWLLELMVSRSGKPESDSSSIERTFSHEPCAGLLDAARAYLNRVGPPAPGSRNQTVFNVAGHLAAFVVRDTHESLDEQQVTQLLLKWNRMLPEPLDDAEVASTVSSAFMNGEPREPKLVDPDDPPETDSAESRSRRPALADELIELARAELDIFRSHHGGEYCYAATRETTPSQTMRISSKAFEDWLRLRYFHLHQVSVNDTAMKQAVGTLTALASASDDVRPVFRRIGGVDDHVYVDLCRPDGKVVEITSAGWSLTTQPPVHFLRSANMQPLPIPQRGGQLTALREFLNLEGKDDWTLLLSWIASVLRPNGPYPLLMINGEQGSACSFNLRQPQSADCKGHDTS